MVVILVNAFGIFLLGVLFIQKNKNADYKESLKWLVAIFSKIWSWHIVGITHEKDTISEIQATT